jgi:hypothetical protein
VAGFLTTAKKRYPNASGIARLGRSNSPASAFDYLRRCLSTDVRYQEAHGMMRTTVRARFRQQVVLRDQTNVKGTGN